MIIEDKLNRKIAELDRANCMFDVVLSGVPFLSGEKNSDLLKMFNNIIKSIECVPIVPKNIFRLKHKHNLNIISSMKKAAPPPKIIIEFGTMDDKKSFMRSYFENGSLDLSMIGYDATDRIFCNDSLPVGLQPILHRALQEKRGKTISSAFSKNGFVFLMIHQLKLTLLMNSMNLFWQHLLNLYQILMLPTNVYFGYTYNRIIFIYSIIMFIYMALHQLF